MAGVEGDDVDVFGYHYEDGMLAVNLFHMRGGKVVDRREFFWEDLPEFGTAVNASAASDVGPALAPGATGVPPVEGVADVVQSGLETNYEPGCSKDEARPAVSVSGSPISEPGFSDFDPSSFFSAF